VFQRNINSYPIRRSFSSSNEFKPTFVILDFRDEVTVLQELVEFFDVSASMAEVEQYFISILTEYLCSTQPTTAWNQIWELLEDQADTLVYTGQVDAISAVVDRIATKTLHHLPGHSVLPNVPTATDINRIGTGIVRLEINPEYVTRLHRNRLGGR
jgi:hypothetical protein